MKKKYFKCPKRARFWDTVIFKVIRQFPAAFPQFYGHV